MDNQKIEQNSDSPKITESEEHCLHKKIGTQQKLFMFHELSPSSCFFLPHGTRIYNKLMEMIKSEYTKREFHEVITPNLFNCDLWKNSGHYEFYKNNMFSFTVEDREWSMKPMNCPAACLVYKSDRKSIHDLPIRYADFGVLHRNELSGALRGLTRVRRFQQDDAHIFCTLAQVEEQIDDCLDFLDSVYSKLGLSYKMELSTRPEKYIGSEETWDFVENQLKKSMDKFCGNKNMEFKINEGDGAFYGPKIDIHLTDSHGKELQCGTIQLDSQLPERFNLLYQDESGWHRPLIIHRAILGSVERMFAVLTEHYNGNWPFWLSPRQINIVPIFAKEPLLSYGKEIRDLLRQKGFYVDFDISTDTLNKKIVKAEEQKYNYVLVIGKKEMENKMVNLRDCGSKSKEDLSLEELVEKLTNLNQL